MQFAKRVTLGGESFTLMTDDFIELSEISRRIAEMNRVCGGKGYMRVREAEKKAGKRKATTVTYRELVRYVEKLPFDNGEFERTLVKMRISPETEPKYESWPWFIYRTQRWNWHDPDSGKDYFLDTDNKWYEGSYDSASGEWSRV